MASVIVHQSCGFISLFRGRPKQPILWTWTILSFMKIRFYAIKPKHWQSRDFNSFWPWWPCNNRRRHYALSPMVPTNEVDLALSRFTEDGPQSTWCLFFASVLTGGASDPRHWSSSKSTLQRSEKFLTTVLTQPHGIYQKGAYWSYLGWDRVCPGNRAKKNALLLQQC